MKKFIGLVILFSGLMLNADFIDSLMSDAHLYEGVSTGATINIDSIISFTGATMIGNYAVWKESLSVYNDSSWNADTGEWGPTCDPFPPSLILRYAINATGDFWIGVTGGTESEGLAVLTESRTQDKLTGNVYNDWNGNKYQDSIFIEEYVTNDIRENVLVYVMMQVYKDFYNNGYVTGGPSTPLEFMECSFNLKSNYTKSIYLLRSYIFHQHMDYSWYDTFSLPVDSTRNYTWSPSSVLDDGDSDLILMREFNIHYINPSGAYLTVRAHNDNGDSSRIFLDSVRYVYQHDWGEYNRKTADYYPSTVRIEAYTDWSSVHPNFRMAVLADSIWCDNVNEWFNGTQNPTNSFDQNPSPFILKISPTSGIVEKSGTQTAGGIQRLFPNPTRGNITISYSIPVSGDVKIDVYDVMGRKVNEMIKKHQEKGNHRVLWDGRDFSGNMLPSGIYWVKITGKSIRTVKKMVKIR